MLIFLFFGLCLASGHFSAQKAVLNHPDAPNQGFEVSYPYVFNSNYGPAVSSVLLLNYTFGNTQTPAAVEYVPPNVDFNKVILTFNTSVSGVQFDRLAHVYMDDIELWRTSTIEPAGKTRSLSFSKDVSAYAGLFSKNSTLEVQLDNVVDSTYTGEFDTQVFASFFYSSGPVYSGDDESGVLDGTEFEGDYDIFSTAKPADQVYGLSKESQTLDNMPLEATLPQVPQNTTRLRLAVFLSGNADEEFWYTNLLDKYNSQFVDDSGIEHGPARFFNIYVGGTKVATQTVHPVVFTGGISPMFWIPAVSNNAFDLKSYDLDLSAVLPLLWAGPASLAVEVVNGVDQFTGGDSGVGNNWIISANLLTYESEKVLGANGTSASNWTSGAGNSVGRVSNGSSLVEMVTSKFGAGVSSEVLFDLGSAQLETSFKLETSTEIANVQYANSSVGFVVHAGHSEKQFGVVANGVDLISLNTNLNYPIYVGLGNNSGQVVNIIDTSVVLNGQTVVQTSAVQNGSVQEVWTGPSSVTGTGYMQTQFNLQMNAPYGRISYSRAELGLSNGTVYSDTDLDTAGSFVAPLALEDPGDYGQVQQYIVSSFHNSYLDLIYPVLAAAGVLAGALPSSHEM